MPYVQLSAVILACAAVIGLTPAYALGVTAATGDDCTITGTRGPDRLTGTAGRDVICGRGGDDVLVGRGGRDLLDAGRGHDKLHGGPDDDVLLGRGGDDRLDGGSGEDVLRGGAGVNWCDLAAGETSGCTADTHGPELLEVTYPTSIDLTDAAGVATVRVHAVDDTGVHEVLVELCRDECRLWQHAERVSGTATDGWWEAKFRFRAGLNPRTFTSSLTEAFDVGGYTTVRAVGHDLEIRNHDPDWVAPVVELLDPAPGTTYDFAEGGHLVVVTAHVTDDDSGVRDVLMALESPPSYPGDPPQFYSPTRAELVTGDRRDGVWQLEVPVTQDELTGTWKASAFAFQRSDWGEAEPAEGSTLFTFADSASGRMARYQDIYVPSDELSTADGPARFELGVWLRDSDPDGVTSVSASYHDAGGNPVTPWTPLALSWGDATDGVWRGDFELPQGTPPGPYFLTLDVSEPNRSRHWVSPESPEAADPLQLVLPEGTVTVR